MPGSHWDAHATEPLAAAYVARAQGVQEVTPVEEKDPGGQGEGAEEPAAQKEPGGQMAWANKVRQ